MLLRLAVPLLVSFLLGLAIAGNLALRRPVRPVVLWVAPILGIGMSGLFTFLWSLVFYPSFQPWLALAIEACLAAAGLSLFIYRWQRSPVEATPAREPDVPRWQRWLVVSACLVAFPLAALIFISSQVENPYGMWDAWTIWNTRAKYLFLGGQDWRTAFSPFLHGSDYPVMVSFFIARGWALLGSASVAVPITLAATFAVSTAGVLYAAVSERRGRLQGALAALVLVCTLSFLYWSTSQFADVPLSGYLLAAGVFYYLFRVGERPGGGLLALSGLLAGLAAWTKNEGLFLLTGLAAVEGLRALTSPTARRGWRAWLGFVAGIALPLISWIYFKSQVAPANYALNQTRGALLEKLTAEDRWGMIASYFSRELVHFGRWEVPLLLVLVLVAGLVGLNRGVLRREGNALASLAGVLAIVLAGYWFSYQVTTMPLNWQLGESIERLFLQVYPLFLFLYFNVVGKEERDL